MERSPPFARLLLALGGMLGTTLVPHVAAARSPILEVARTAKPELARARELDAQGVRAYREGRYRDAILLFAASYRQGGPSLELWNVARCHQRLDEGDDAAEVLARYLAADDLYPRDRADATRELAELRRRPSTLVVESPPGATVTVDGRRAGTVPVAIEVAAGRHVVRVDEKPNDEGIAGEGYEAIVEALHGRPLLLPEDRSAATPGSLAASAGADHDRNRDASDGKRLELDVQGGLSAQKLGAIAAHAGPAGTIGVRALFGRGAFASIIGVRAHAYGTGWATVAGDVAPPGCALPDHYDAIGVAGTISGGVAWSATRTVRVSLELGFGAEGLLLDRGGGAAFNPDCAPAPGATPLFDARADVSFRLSEETRVVLSPIAFSIHPAYSNTRASPDDATGAWLRLGATLGFSYGGAL